MSNCLLYALGRWWREGGYLIVRRSRFWHHPLGFHLLWSPDLLRFYDYAPTPAIERPWWWKPLWFRGTERCRAAHEDRA